MTQLNLHDLRQIGFRQSVEHNRVIDAVQELRPEMLPHLFQHGRLHPVVHFADASILELQNRWLPMFDVMMTMVFLKSTVRPCPSVSRPSSSTCSSTLNTSGCAFSISSNSTTQ